MIIAVMDTTVLKLHITNNKMTRYQLVCQLAAQLVESAAPVNRRGRQGFNSLKSLLLL